MANDRDNIGHLKNTSINCLWLTMMLLLFVSPYAETKRMPARSHLDCLYYATCRLHVLQTQTIQIGDKKLTVYIAQSAMAKALGLSGVSKLSDHQGMLFVYQNPLIPGFWMKNMRFAIDIFWIDVNQSITSILHTVSPQTYPKIFHPPSSIRYVLETKAGFAKAHGISVGDTITFTSQ